MKATLCTLLLAASLLTACSNPKDGGSGGDAVNVQSLNQDFIGAWNNKDSGKITGLLADDVTFVQGNVHWKGKAEVSQKWVGATLSTINKLKTSVLSSGTDASTAYEAGTFSVDVLPEAAGQPGGIGEGNYIFLWKKAPDNTWKLSYAQLEDLPVQRRN